MNNDFIIKTIKLKLSISPHQPNFPKFGGKCRTLTIVAIFHLETTIIERIFWECKFIALYVYIGLHYENSGEKSIPREQPNQK